ncbi:protein SCO2 homolog, mitochondrial [Aplysia californica]|uniref:Protein SCO2 homolog, mitochondrial n=1 Tax=Aplysia californica TaxID=6500 RepID=A0ABM0K2X8_APLCA|nr:protein SCO2 homolog, mitochondrial [Aplysia californica]
MPFRSSLTVCCRCLSLMNQSSRARPGLLQHGSDFKVRLKPMLYFMSTQMPDSFCLRRDNITMSSKTKLPNDFPVKHFPVRKVLVPGLRFYSSRSGSDGKGTTLNIPWWQRLVIVSGIAGITYYLVQGADHQKDIESEKVRYKEFDKAKLGGDWTLTDHHGNKRSSSDFRGHWMLIYFGFTHCPDICPEELEKLANIIKKFDEAPHLPNLQPIFITLDPERDTPAAIKDYCAEFKTPRLLGFTGTEDEIRAVAKKYRVYFGKGPRDADNDYIVDHTIIIYLVNPEGEFVNYFGRSLNADQITESVTKHIDKYNELKKVAKS